ncbi:MAG: N-acetylglucosamine-6-phosphate deacetylase [Vicinamibacterales bacterium]
MIVLAGADLVLPGRVLHGGTLIIDAGRIVAIEPRIVDGPEAATRIDLSGHVIVPGFIDVHVHGVEGIDVLDGAAAVAAVARRLPRYGVTAFCPTSVACEPAALSTLLASVSAAQQQAPVQSSRVLGAHLESNFINPEWKGAQPAGCLRVPLSKAESQRQKADGEFTGRDILAVIARHRSGIGIITLAPELPGGIDLVRELVAAGHRVSIGHTGATYEQARDAIAAGVSQATHLFNRMSPITARSPGVVGAVLESDAVAAEIICDAFHVHPSLVALAVRAKSTRLVMAITDGTAGSGLPAGSRARLGSQSIVVTEKSALLEDGTLAGSILTMDGAFRMLVERLGLALPEAARMCASTPAERLGLADCGRLEAGLLADLTVLDAGLRVRQTYVSGAPALEH